MFILEKGFQIRPRIAEGTRRSLNDLLSGGSQSGLRWSDALQSPTQAGMRVKSDSFIV